jgi:hypothetical protein
VNDTGKAEKWWRRQSASHPSHLPNSLITGKIRGNLVDLTPDPKILQASRYADSITYEQIPYLEEQGI